MFQHKISWILSSTKKNIGQKLIFCHTQSKSSIRRMYYSWHIRKITLYSISFLKFKVAIGFVK